MKVIVDMMNIVFIEFNVARRQLREKGDTLTEDNLPFYAHLLFSKMNTFFKTYGELDICWEGKNSLSFRRGIFPDYKRNRDKSKTEDEYIILKKYIPKIEEALNFYPCKQYKIEGAEGDDMMYALSKVYIEEMNEEVMVISTDGDLVQFKNFWGDKINIYNPIKKVIVKEKPEILAQKAIVGDSSDNIPGLYRVGIKTFEKMLEDKNKWNEVINKGDNKKIYENFIKIVDLRQAPKEILSSIKEEIIKPYNVFQSDSIELFFWENKLLQSISRWETIKNEIYKVIRQGRTIQEIHKEEKTELIIEEEDEIDKILGEYT